MGTFEYETITGRKLNLSQPDTQERRFLEEVSEKYQAQPEWTEFASWWMARFDRTGLKMESVAYRLCQDLEARLGIAQDKVSPPDYRDYLADLIEERYGSRSKFCKESGIDPGHLSRVLAHRAEFSLQSLQAITKALQATLVIQSQERLKEHFSPSDAHRALAAAVAA